MLRGRKNYRCGYEGFADKYSEWLEYGAIDDNALHLADEYEKQ